MQTQPSSPSFPLILSTAVLLLTGCGESEGETPTEPEPSPEITSIAPTAGPEGASVTIEGSAFGSTPSQNSVAFGGTPAEVTSATSTRLETAVPEGAASGSVTVTVEGRTATGPAFTVEPAVPTITSMVPDRGTELTEVIITGTNFSPTPTDNAVAFGGVDAKVTRSTEIELTTNVPDGAKDGPVTVTVAGQTVTGPSFDVLTTGTLAVAAATDGPDPDADGYRLSIDGVDLGAVAVNGAASDDVLHVPDLKEGSYQPELTDIAPNCSVVGENPRSASIVAGDTTLVVFEVTCGTPTGSLEISTTTGGPDPDADGYELSVDGLSGGPIAANGSVTLSDLEPGSREVELTDVADNCSVSGDNPREVSVVAGATSPVDFEITCQQLLGALQLTVATMGPHPDPNGYWVFIDGEEALGGLLPINASRVLRSLTPGSHSISLSDVSPHCSVSGANPRNVSIVGGDTASTRFDVSCDTTTIAFTSDRDGGLDIFRMDGDGTDVRQLTFLANTEEVFSPLISPDRARIVLSAYGIFVMDADGDNIEELVHSMRERNRATSWSPDGSVVLFHSGRDDPSGTDREIYTVSADGSLISRLTNNPQRDYDAAWSPDGTRIAFVSERNGNPEIYTMTSSTTDLTRLTFDAASDGRPSWSPDGTKIVFQSDRNGSLDLYVMDPDGTDVTRLTDHPASDLEPVWSPYGTRIAFSSDRNGNFEIYTINADGSGVPTNITNDPSDDRSPSWR